MLDMSVAPSPRILVVDDDEMLNALFCAFLESEGFYVVSATSVQQAKSILQDNNLLDLILLDYQLGDGVGMDVLKHEVMSRPDKKIPVIMISANEAPEFLIECFSVGVNDYIIKPVNLPLLALKINALLASIKMQRLIAEQTLALKKFKEDAEREEHIAQYTYEYLLRQYSSHYTGIEVWLKSFAAFSGDMSLAKKSPSGNLFFMLADATGHGLSAAITIMPVLTIFNTMVEKGFSVSDIVAELNRQLVNNTPEERFVAAIVLEINPTTRRLSVWNGGMPSMYWVDAGEVTYEFISTYMALGILEDDLFEANVTTIALPDKGFLFSFTDGLSEQKNNMCEQFSTEKVLSIIKRQPKQLLATIASELEEYVGKDIYDDDVSICKIDVNQVFSAAL